MLQTLMQALPYQFMDAQLLQTALTHASTEHSINYERLEFLGDAVLEFIVTDALYKKYPDYQEGQLTALRTHFVREEFLAAWAKKMGLGEYIRLGKSELNSGGKEKASILSDVCEAIIGAIYLDGGLAKAKAFVENQVIQDFSVPDIELDAKSKLQAKIQQNQNEIVTYKVYKTEGPPHDTTFYVEALLNEKVLAKGKGKSKKQATQEAAKVALKNMEI